MTDGTEIPPVGPETVVSIQCGSCGCWLDPGMFTGPGRYCRSCEETRNEASRRQTELVEAVGARQSNLAQRVEGYNTRTNQLASEQTAFNEHAGQLNQRGIAFNERVAAFTATYPPGSELAVEQVPAYQEGARALEAERTALAAEQARLMAESARLESAVAALTSERAGLETERAQIDQEIAELQGRLDAIENEASQAISARAANCPEFVPR